MLQEKGDRMGQGLLPVVSKLTLVIIVLVTGLVVLPFVFFLTGQPRKQDKKSSTPAAVPAERKPIASAYWTAPDVSSITDRTRKEQVEYGKELIAHTAKYLGPNGSVSQISNGMNCQNCHLQAGTAVFGNNYGSVASLYPKFRERSGSIEGIHKRVNDCFERSLNGKALDTGGPEMKAIVAYIQFVGSNVPKGKQAQGSGLKELTFLDRPADTAKGLTVYAAKCQSCHGADGSGIFNSEKTEYIYPPLWGNNSFNDGAGLYRLSNFAKFIKYNMPQGVTHESPQLSDEEAWDVSAYINTRQRPHINVRHDWPKRASKPYDHPFGPYADSFSQSQHKLGPFQAIVEAKKERLKQ